MKSYTTIKDFVAGNGSIAYGHDLKSLNGTYSKKDISYPERAIMIAGQDDYVFVNQKLSDIYIAYLKEAGIGPKKVVYFESPDLHHGLDKIINLVKDRGIFKNITYSPFISRTKDIDGAQSIGMNVIGNNPEITEQYYDKASFKQKCLEIGIPTAIGPVFEKSKNSDEDKIRLMSIIKSVMEDTSNKRGEVIIRACNSEGGIGIFTANKDNIPMVLDAVIKEDETKFLVEVMEDVLYSPSAIGMITKDAVSLFAYTTQILDKQGIHYQGTLIDENQKIPADVALQFNKIGENMRKEGYRGAFGIDFIRLKDQRLLPCENNARITAGFYPWELKKRIEDNNGKEFKAVMSMNFESNSMDNFDELYKNKKINSMLYKKGKTSGIVPFRVSDIGKGEICYIALGDTKKDVETISSEFEKTLKQYELYKNILRKSGTNELKEINK